MCVQVLWGFGGKKTLIYNSSQMYLSISMDISFKRNACSVLLHFLFVNSWIQFMRITLRTTNKRYIQELHVKVEKRALELAAYILQLAVHIFL